MTDILSGNIQSPQTISAEIVTSQPTVNAEITTNQPAVAASLSELRYLVYQGMIGPDGQSAYELAVELGFEGTEEDWIASLKGERGETLGWDVTDDGEGNVEMTYPDGVINSQKSVLFEEQELTSAQQAQARENIDAAAISDIPSDMLRYTEQTLTSEQQIQSRENIGAASASELNSYGATILSHSMQLETISNVANIPRLASSSAYGVTFVYNTTTGEYDLSGTATATFYHTASNGLISSETAAKPPAGVYRLEITAYRMNGTVRTAVDANSVWGSLNCSKTNTVQESYPTDATGVTREVTLDGDTMVDVRWHIAYGTVTDNMHIKIALRRFGMSDMGEMLVGQADQMQAMKRKMLGVTRMLRYAYNTQKALEKVFELPLVSDADNAVRSGYIMFARYNGDTLNSPYKQGITDNMQQGAIVGFANGSYAIQVALRYAANPKLYVRSGTYSSSLNNGEGGYAFNPWLLIQTATA